LKVDGRDVWPGWEGVVIPVPVNQPASAGKSFSFNDKWFSFSFHLPAFWFHWNLFPFHAPQPEFHWI